MRAQRNMTTGCRPSRNRPSVWVRAGAGASLVLLLAGCGTSTLTRGAAFHAPSTGSTTTVRWLDGFCGAVNDFMTDTGRIQLLPADPDDGRRSTSKLLGDYAAILDTAIDRLAALPPVSDPVGQTAKQTFVENYTAARDQATSAKAQLDAAAPTDYHAVVHASDAMVAVQQKALSALSPQVEIMSSVELREAIISARRCASGS